MGRHSQRAGLAVAVALAHGLLLLAFGQAVLPRLRQSTLPALPAPVAVRLIERFRAAPLPLPNHKADVATAPRPPLGRSREALSNRRTDPPRQPQAISAEAPAVEAAPVASDAVAASAPMAARDNASATLGLSRLGEAASAPRTMREQMQGDPRSNSPRATLATRLAAVAGTTGMVEEVMDDTRRRVRQNGRCIEVHVSRNARIDPWNQSTRPTPKLVKPSCE